MADARNWYTTQEVAELIRVHRDSVARWIRTGELEAVRTPGGTYRIPREAVEKLLRRLSGPP